MPRLSALTQQATLLAILAMNAVAHGQVVSAGSEQHIEPTDTWKQDYLNAVRLTQDAQWADALAIFRKVATAHDGPVVQFNIAYCERALGDYVAARESLARLLAAPAGLPDNKLLEARGYLNEIDQVLVRVTLTMQPPPRRLEVDGRPLRASRAEAGSWILGDDDDEAAPWTAGPQVIILTPGVHIFRATRDGHEPAIVRKSYREGEHVHLDVKLNLLPATLMVRSEPPRAVVRVNDRDEGLTPVRLVRPAGRYRIEVFHEGYERVSSEVELQAGQELTVPTSLVRYREPLRRKWWFWTGTIVLLGAVAGTTYGLVKANQPEPQPPPYDGGSTDWVF